MIKKLFKQLCKLKKELEEEGEDFLEYLPVIVVIIGIGVYSKLRNLG
jgi:hypothetical protein